VLDTKPADSTAIDELAVLKNIAFCYNELGDFDSEISVEERILNIQQRQNASNNAIEKTLQNLSAIHVQKKDYIKAVRCNEEILRRAEADGNYLSVTQANNNLGYIYHLLQQPGLSAEYFDKSYRLVTEKEVRLNDDDRANILINLGVVNVNMGNLAEAKTFFLKAYDIRTTQNDPIKIAQSLNYLATYDYLQNELDKSASQTEKAISLLISAPPGDLRESTAADSYKIMAQIMLKKNDLQSFRKYNDLFTKQQDQIIQKERRRNKQLVDRQLEAERTKNEIRILLAEQEKTKFKILQADLEQQKKEQELQLKTSELQMLKKNNELQAEKYKNKDLETQRISQMLELEKQRSNSLEQQQKIALLQKQQEVQQLQLEKQNKEVAQLERDKKQNREIRNYNLLISALLFLLLLIALNLYFYRNRKNRILTGQNATISRMNQEISVQNEELMSMNDKLNEQTEELHQQNDRLLEAQEIIHEQHEKLISHSKNLEEEVERRTHEIRNTNAKLVKSNTQMEQFTYAISHNLRAPIARLLGLINIIQYANEQERKFILDKIKESSFDLDGVIKDLSMILDSKYQVKEINEPIDLNAKLEKTKLILDKIIDESHAQIDSDFSRGHILYANNSYIESIFYNLLSNALKYRSPERACIIKISTEIRGDLFILSFSDNGLGIDLKKYGDKVFGLYKRFNLEIEGKGLGLYLVKAHAQAMGGEAHIESAPDQGTTFKIILPIKKIKTEEVQPQIAHQQS
ncbi:MAG: hypothetical protein HYR67_15645, partial [Bacteroidetes bacterium]|nr:hypothetical protein [Bacteroidota bacterium]